MDENGTERRSDYVRQTDKEIISSLATLMARSSSLQSELTEHKNDFKLFRIATENQDRILSEWQIRRDGEMKGIATSRDIVWAIVTFFGALLAGHYWK